MIKLENICVSYGEKVVYNNFGLQLNEGEITCVLGESGCGKTTLLNVVASMIPYSGNVPELTCSYVFQTPRLLPNMTVKDNLKLVCGDDGKVDNILTLTGLADKAARYPKQLSGGEAQRVSVCRAFLFKSDILLLDEPFTSLDLKLKISLMEQFKLLQSGEKRTTLFVTHDVDEALYFADRIVVLDGGKAVWDVPNNKSAAYGEASDLRPQLIAKLLDK